MPKDSGMKQGHVKEFLKGEPERHTQREGLINRDRVKVGFYKNII